MGRHCPGLALGVAPSPSLSPNPNPNPSPNPNPNPDQEGAINIAYTGEPLASHMDLCYYESPPGLQLLHCLAFDGGVEGGETTLIDAFAVAEQLRREEPEVTLTLSLTLTLNLTLTLT